MALPSGYKRLEYIQSSGTQYIDEGFKPNQDTRVVFDVDWAPASTASWLFGCRTSNTAETYNFLTYSNKYRSDYNATTSGAETSSTPSGRFIIDKDKNITKIDGVVVNTLTYASFQCKYNMYLFANNNAGSVAGNTSAKLYSCQVYDNGTLVRDYIPCQTTAGEIGLWDDVNSVFYGNAGTGTFTAGPVIAIAVAVSEVTELEYIQSSGEQYVNTGVSAPIGFRITCDVLLTSIANTLNMLFGSHDAASPYYRNFLAATSGGKWEIGAYNPYDFGTAAINTSYAIDVCTISGEVSCTINGSAQSIDTSIAASTVRSSRSIYVFALNYPGGLFQASMELCTLQIYLDAEKTNFVRDYMAAKLSDGTVGLYDKLNGLLYINVGTGAFTAGPEVPKAPSAPSLFTASALSDTTVQLRWTASDGASGYNLYKNGGLLATLTDTSYTDAVQVFSGTVYAITAYNDDGESEATTLTYYSTPENPILYLVTDRTAADVTDRNEKGTYRSADLNRVGFAVQYLAEYLGRHGTQVHVSPKRDWTDIDNPTPQTMTVYLADIAALRATLKLPEETPMVPADMVKLTYQEANDIESILVVLDEMIGKMISVVDAGWTSGIAYTGFYFKEATV